LDTIKSVSERMCEVRKKLGYDGKSPFALGLWLDADAVEELTIPTNLAKLQSILSLNNFYVFTVNAFPYGKFHKDTIKDDVYKPNWNSEQRVEFTCKIADILAILLPKGITGSISTLPGGYKEHLIDSSCKKISLNLLRSANHLAELENRTGKKIILGIEMEPDCIWESPEEFCEFRNKYLSTPNGLKYIGVCYDTCHQELLENRPENGLNYLVSKNIPIAKIQCSAALKSTIPEPNSALIEELANFADHIYLHQTRFFDKTGKIIKKYNDIPDTKISNNALVRVSQIYTHFHTPIYIDTISANFATAKNELFRVIEVIKKYPEICSNIEIETYTYSVLPKKIKPESMEQMIIKEYQWILKKLQTKAR